jgi:hypothetical protein
MQQRNRDACPHSPSLVLVLLSTAIIRHQHLCIHQCLMIPSYRSIQQSLPLQ